MDDSEWDAGGERWRDQELAQFARRAHRRLGRGFVLHDSDDEQPVYVTWLVGAPDPLVEAVYCYDPDNEALVVSMGKTKGDSTSVILSRVTIERSH